MSLIATPPEQEIRVVAITGGVHGNEATGVALARHLLRHPQLADRPSFETKVLFVNVPAIERNVRYVDEDLNRCFFANDLADSTRNSSEAVRAREINAMLGPKGSSNPAADLVIDLHNTTSNTGVALMMPPKDELSHAVGSHLMRQDPTVRLVSYTEGKDDYPTLATVARHGMTFEVGAVPWGCIDGALFHKSLRLLMLALDYVHAHNLAVRAGNGSSSNGSGSSNKDGSAWHTVTVPVYRNVRTVNYPRYEDAVGPGAQGTIAAAVHPDIRGKDFVMLRRGDPTFLTIDGGKTIGFDEDRSEEDGDDICYPFFIDEASYYEKGIAFFVAHRADRRVQVLKLI